MTDPMALGAERSWGCLCSKFTSFCPYHAVLRQKKRLAKLFPGRVDGDPDLPFFPTVDGHFVSADAQVELIETLAQLLGEPLAHKSGVHKFGRHPWRATGAVHLTGKRLELFRVQLLARWASPVILHYARLAPLVGLTEHVRELQEVESLSTVANGIQQGLTGIEAKLRALDDNTAKLIRMEAHIQALTTKLDETNAGPIFVQNTVTLKTHRVVCGTHWRTHVAVNGLHVV